MKEREMRKMVQDFLAATAKKVVLPASLGLGLALTGCGGADDASANYAATDRDGSVVTLDTGSDTLPSGLDNVIVKYGAPMPDRDAAVGPIVVKYAAPMPDMGASLDGQMVVKYAAPLPDAGAIAKYGAPFPCAHKPCAVPLYGAPYPDESGDGQG